MSSQTAMTAASLFMIDMAWGKKLSRLPLDFNALNFCFHSEGRSWNKSVYDAKTDMHSIVSVRTSSSRPILKQPGIEKEITASVMENGECLIILIFICCFFART